jgi:hypothetical protein
MIPATALPTLSRSTEGHLVGHHSNLKISAEVSCLFEVVAIVGDLFERKILESTSVRTVDSLRDFQASLTNSVLDNTNWKWIANTP